MRRSKLERRIADNAKPYSDCIQAVSRLAKYLSVRYSPIMRLISNRALREFAARHPQATTPLQAWRKLIEQSSARNHAGLKRLANSVDRVGDYYVFDIGGNKYRIVAAVHFDRQMLFVRHVFTHAEYDDWRP